MGRFLLLLALAATGCQLFRVTSKPPTDALPDLEPVRIDYADTEAFDAQFEAALVAGSFAVVVQTENSKPDWTGRLNAWIAAWNAGGRSKARTIRGQPGLAKLDGDSLRELRLLAGDLLDRAEGLATAGGAWYSDARMRSQRAALLKPYSLRFHREAGLIRLVFFHGDYAAYYPRFLQGLRSGEGAAEWSRTVECSECERADRVGRLVAK
ncbi:MAG: hypothetical protein K2W96_12045 [Gemmataceae bacterium]|nr:hypothetical protein [Gemmataceae bacterium]